MKTLLLFTLTSLLSIPAISQEEKTSPEELKVREAIVNWADETFYSHSDYRFENYHVFWTEEYEISMMRTEAYAEMLGDLEKDKKAGKYNGTDEEYDTEYGELKEKYDGIVESGNNITNKADYYQISFWSNIQTNDGITVYYELVVKVSDAFIVTSATINSSIGTKSESTEIIYKKGADQSIVKKKVNSSENTNQPTGNVDSNSGNIDKKDNSEGNGSVGITLVTDVNEEPIEETEDIKGKKEKKNKRKKKKKKKK